MQRVQDLQLKPLAQSLLPEFVEKHSYGFLDGGCHSFAQAVHDAFPDTTTTVSVFDIDSIHHHSMVKVRGEELYGDADGWHTWDDFKANFLKNEGVEVVGYKESDILADSAKYVDVFLDLEFIDQASDFIKGSENITFRLPLDSNDSIWVSCGMFDGGSAAVTSDIVVDCEGIPGAFVDGIESLVLGQFCAGVDVCTSEYCEGIETALQAMVNGLVDCTCLVCQKEEACEDGNMLIHRSRRVNAVVQEDIVYSINRTFFEEYLEENGDFEDSFESIEFGDGDNELTRISVESEVVDINAVLEEDVEEL